VSDRLLLNDGTDLLLLSDGVDHLLLAVQIPSLTAADLIVASPVLGTPIVTLPVVTLTPVNLTVASPALGVPSLSSVAILTAAGLTLASPILGTPALTPPTVVTAVNLAVGSPIIGVPSLTTAPGIVSLTAVSLTVQSPVISVPPLPSGGQAYLVQDYPTGQTAAEVIAYLNNLGSQGWEINAIDMINQNQRRAIFTQANQPVEYEVVDYDTGKPAATVQSDLNGYGTDGWLLSQVDLSRQNQRRAIFLRGQNGNALTVPEAPLDGDYYARRSGTWDGLNDVFMRWVAYTGPPQSFLKQDLTRDGDWTMVANKNTSDRPAPQQTAAAEDLLPAWTPTQQSARATFTVRNEFTLSQAGWIDQYGVDVNAQNANAVHAISLTINGVVRDSLTVTPSVAGIFWQNITPLLVFVGTKVRVSVQVTQVSNNLMYWDQQVGFFATAPNYCSLAQGWKDAASPGTTAYDCHCMFIPGTASPDWDVVAFGGAAVGGGTTGNLPVYAVANLTAAATAGAGAQAFVTDATAATFNSIVAGGGSNGVPVFSDGSNWRIG
jgi:hypothetical protein